MNAELVHTNTGTPSLPAQTSGSSTKTTPAAATTRIHLLLLQDRPPLLDLSLTLPFLLEPLSPPCINSTFPPSLPRFLPRSPVKVLLASIQLQDDGKRSVPTARQVSMTGAVLEKVQKTARARKNPQNCISTQRKGRW